MLRLTKGNLLESDVEALVNTVNCEGYMGKGIALQFKEHFPENFKAYRLACQNAQIKIGSIFVFQTGFLKNPKFILNFPTKGHWREKSSLKDIESGLKDLVYQIELLKIKSIAIPPLGCGLGGLKWNNVKPLILKALEDLNSVDIMIFEPNESINTLVPLKSPAKMTKSRALFIKLIERYKMFDYRLNLLEIQKLAYFLQEAGESLRLNYKAAHYGPYAHNLGKVLAHLEGNYIKGYRDNKPDSEIELMEGAIEAADKFITSKDDSYGHLIRVQELIEGFETPYGLELLASIHWLAHHNNPKAVDEKSAIKLMQAWNSRKKSLFNPYHIQVTWQHLKTLGWLPSFDN